MLDGPGDFVTLELTRARDDKLWYEYQGAKNTLRLNTPTTVPWDHMVYLLGDPFYTGQDRKICHEFICRRNGVSTNQPLPYAITAKDQDGDVISTVVDDPEGASAPTNNPTEALDPVAIRQALVNMTRRQAELERQLAAYEAQQAGDEDKDDLPRPAAKKRAARRKDTTTSAAESPVPLIGEPTDDNPLIPEDSPTVLPVGAPQ